MFYFGSDLDEKLAKMFSWGNSIQVDIELIARETESGTESTASNRNQTTQSKTESLIMTSRASVGLLPQSSMDTEVSSFVQLRSHLADFASKQLHLSLDANFKRLGTKTPTDDEIITVINKSFDEIVA